MSSDLPIRQEVFQEYFGETDWIKCLEICDARKDPNKSYYIVSDLTCDTSLCPYRAEGPFETPIPTLAEVVAAYDRSKSGPWRVGPYMVRVGNGADILREAENLIYLEKNSSVRAPKVFAVFSSQDPFNENTRQPDEEKSELDRQPYYFLVMEYIEGEVFSDVCKELMPGIQWKIGRQLGEQLRRLRSVPAEDPNHFGRVNGREYPHEPPYRFPPAPDFYNYGPFNYEELVERLIHCAKIESAISSHGEDYDPVEKLKLRDARTAWLDLARPSDRLPVLTHMEANACNIIVKLVRDKAGKVVDVEEVVLIGWEKMCWMPAWYEAGDMCWSSIQPREEWQHFGKEALSMLGDVNMILAAFFSECKRTATFFFS